MGGSLSQSAVCVFLEREMTLLLRFLSNNFTIHYITLLCFYFAFQFYISGDYHGHMEHTAGHLTKGEYKVALLDNNNYNYKIRIITTIM